MLAVLAVHVEYMIPNDVACHFCLFTVQRIAVYDELCYVCVFC